MDVVSTEATAWTRAADVAGVELPDSIAQARENLESIEAQLAALPQPTKVPSPAELVAAGTSLDKAAAEVEQLTQAENAKSEAHRVARSAREIARRTLSRLVAEERDVLIHAARPVLARFIEEARPLAETLAPFAPKYDAGDIVRRADQKQIKAWRRAEELEGMFGTVLAGWRASFRASNVQGGYKSPGVVRNFDVRWVDQVHRYWERPERVVNVRLNGRHLNQYGYPTPINPTVLAVASECPEAGWRLTTMTELKEAYDAARFAAIEEARAAAGQRRHGRGMAV